MSSRQPVNVVVPPTDRRRRAGIRRRLEVSSACRAAVRLRRAHPATDPPEVAGGHGCWRGRGSGVRAKSHGVRRAHWLPIVPGCCGVTSTMRCSGRRRAGSASALARPSASTRRFPRRYRAGSVRQSLLRRRARDGRGPRRESEPAAPAARRARRARPVGRLHADPACRRARRLVPRNGTGCFITLRR